MKKMSVINFLILFSASVSSAGIFEVCDKLTGPHAIECQRVAAYELIDDGAADLCGTLGSQDAIVECLNEVTWKDYSQEALSFCADIEPTKLKQCLVLVGTPVK